MDNNTTYEQEFQERMNIEFEKILKQSYSESKRAVKRAKDIERITKKDIERLTKSSPLVHH